MKSIRKLLFLTGIFCSSMSLIKAQNITDNKVYRVTAYKLGDNSVKSVSNYAEIIPPLTMYIPSAFSPNGDGLNDMFGVKGEGIKDFELVVFNRWGEVIFESRNSKQQWDGKFKGSPVEQGTYVYRLFASGGDKNGRTGAVTLVY